MTTFDRYLPAILEQAAIEAGKDGSSTVEAQHLLLAMAADDEPTIRTALSSVGLDYAAIRAALDREFEHSLAAAGVSAAAFDLPRPGPTPDRRPQPGSSVRLVLERGLATVARKRDLRPAHLLLGILAAQVGTVPRALALAEVDRAELAERARQTLAPAGG